MNTMLTTLAVGGVIAVSAALGFAQNAQAEEDGPATIIEVAEQIATDVEERCQTPLREAALAATEDPAALTDLDEANRDCAAVGQQYAWFVEVVKTHADAVTVSIPEDARAVTEAALAAVTPAVEAQVEAGDIEGAVITLFEAVAPQFDIEEAVAR